MGTNGDKSNIASVLVRHALYRGIYSRVAQKVGVDRSYVSRVASGQRRSAKIEKALLKEIQRIERLSRR